MSPWCTASDLSTVFKQPLSDGAPSKAHAEVSYTTGNFVNSSVPCTAGLCAM